MMISGPAKLANDPSTANYPQEGSTGDPSIAWNEVTQ